MKYPHFLIAAALTPMLLLACDDDPTEPQQFANVRIINASPSTANATVSVGGQSLGTVAFRSGSAACVQVPVGSQTLSFSSGGTAVATTPAFNFQQGQGATVVLFGTGTTRTAKVFADNFGVAQTGMNQLRFINAQGAAGDVFVTTPTGAVTGTPNASLAVDAASTGGSAGFLSFPAANTRVRLFNTGVTTGTPRADFTLGTLPSSRSQMIVFAEAGNPAGATAFAVDPCS
jgi:Domain of unknown function (DUF4397)